MSSQWSTAKCQEFFHEIQSSAMPYEVKNFTQSDITFKEACDIKNDNWDTLKTENTDSSSSNVFFYWHPFSLVQSSLKKGIVNYKLEITMWSSNTVFKLWLDVITKEKSNLWLKNAPLVKPFNKMVNTTNWWFCFFFLPRNSWMVY